MKTVCSGNNRMWNSTDIAGIGMTSQRTRNRMVARLRDQGIENESVLSTMSVVPRHLFVDEAMATRAYEDASLPLGEGQTISQPIIVARMTEILLSIDGMNRVLEVGTGSGYQAAVLSRLVDSVYSVERIRSLLLKSRDRFKALGYNNIMTRHSDGSWGWPGQGPYNGILVTAAPSSIPDTLLDQLAINGVLVCPVGKQSGHQVLTVVHRTAFGFHTEYLDAVKFVPFLSGKM